MSKFYKVWFILLLTFCVSGMLFAQAPNAVIVVKGVTFNMAAQPSPNPYKTVASGLANVGRGSNVWLEAAATRGAVPTTIHYDTLVSVTWRLISAPATSTASIIPVDSANGLKGFSARLIPDIRGQYQIGLVVTTSNGTSTEATQWINAGHYVGAGENTDVAIAPQCAFCHTEKFDGWSGTNHSSAFARKIVDPTLQGHFTSNCVSCHSTGYDTNPNAVNGGFDDVALALGWVFPATLKSTNWDSMKISYPTLAGLANIQCESCHGPGSQHAGKFDKNQIAVSLSSDVCGQCHDAPSHHTKNYEWDYSAHANSVAEGTNYQYMNRDPCAQCHTAQGFIDKTIDGGTLAVPYANVQPVSCPTCHDPHDASHEAQLRRPSIAEACTGCHITRISSRGLHTSGQGSMLAGSTGTAFDGQFKPDASGSMIGKIGGWQLPGYSYPNSAHTTINEKCATCHMATAPADSVFGLAKGTLANKLGGHTFKVAWDGGTPDSVSTKDDIVNPTGCVDCHQHINGTVTMDYVRNSQAEIQTLLTQLAALLPQTKGVIKGFTDASLTNIQKVGSYNYNFVTNDGSFGVHNHAYAKALLTSTIEQLKLAAGAAIIDTIKDVPNDQGKAVQVIWEQFPTEKASVDPVVTYGVWRRDAGTVLGKAGGVHVSSLREMFINAAPNTQYVLAGDVWTFVGSVPASKQAQYSFVAPTLFDSTIATGMHMTTFYVSGQTNNAAVVYAAAADSGYSVDNLAPAAPSSVAAKVVAQGVDLSWDPSSAKDFNYFAVYRSTSPDFDIQGVTPIATVTNIDYIDNNVVNGSSFYYKVTAVDYSGNQSVASNPVHATVLGVTDVPALPTEFALLQNYPNPFNPTTEVKYQMPQAGHVRITIYNTLGNEITKLVDQDQSAGYYNVKWNGKDQSGRTVASGIYLYRMETGSFTSVRKMILMK